MNLTISDLKELLCVEQEKQNNNESVWEVGKPYLIRTPKICR